MSFELIITKDANADLKKLEDNKSSAKILKAVIKTLGYLQTNPRHPGLNTHEYTSLSKRFGTKVYEAYVQNNTPDAYRVFWYYGPGKESITIIAITPHP
jgi:mRNA-degrading endonuclease RelE of RelBE toxin-antitoxin system